MVLNGNRMEVPIAMFENKYKELQWVPIHGIKMTARYTGSYVVGPLVKVVDLM